MRRPILGAITVVTALGLLAVMAGSATAAARVCVPRPRKKLSMDEIVALAKKWGAARGLPPMWIVATILIESNGYSDVYGDCDKCFCKSLGLMQVNTVAHADDLKAMGFTRRDMLNPDKNVAMGTRILRDRYDKVVAALAGRTPLAPIATIVRLAYVGPAKILAAIQANTNPRDVFPHEAAKWDVALVRAQALV